MTSKGDGIELIDGGFCANNPALYAIGDAVVSMKNDPASVRVVSLGCGTYPAPPAKWWNLDHWKQKTPGVQLLPAPWQRSRALFLGFALHRDAAQFTLQPLDFAGRLASNEPTGPHVQNATVLLVHPTPQHGLFNPKVRCNVGHLGA